MPNLNDIFAYVQAGSPWLLGPNEHLTHLLITQMNLTCDQYFAMTLKQRVDRIRTTSIGQYWEHVPGQPPSQPPWSYWADQILHNCSATAQAKSTAPSPNITGGAYGHQTYAPPVSASPRPGQSGVDHGQPGMPAGVPGSPEFFLNAMGLTCKQWADMPLKDRTDRFRNFSAANPDVGARSEEGIRQVVGDIGSHCETQPLMYQPQQHAMLIGPKPSGRMYNRGGQR